MALTKKQKAFIQEYLVDLNATQAAIRAGYSIKTATKIASENLTKPDIQKAVQAALPHLKKDGFLYLENESEIPDEMLSKWGLQAVRRGRAGAVYYLLCVRSIG